MCVHVYVKDMFLSKVEKKSKYYLKYCTCNTKIPTNLS